VGAEFTNFQHVHSSNAEHKPEILNCFSKVFFNEIKNLGLQPQLALMAKIVNVKSGITRKVIAKSKSSQTLLVGHYAASK
jgi:hypothetical protein